MNIFNSVKERFLKGSDSGEYSFKQSDTFRGYKRIHLSTYKYEPIQKGLKAVRKKNPDYHLGSDKPKYIYDFANKTITIKKSAYAEDGACMLIMVDNNHVGTIFDNNNNEQIINDFETGKIEAVYLKIDQGQEYNGKKDKVEYSDDSVEAFLFVKRKA